jgi:hypothetical protein
MDHTKFLMKDGLLYKDGRPVFGWGMSYYASYHPQKKPVCDDALSLPMLAEDMAAMREMGFNIIRFAAKGEVARAQPSGQISTQFDWATRVLEEADARDIACFVRLQGYEMILGDYQDGIMLDRQDRPLPPLPEYPGCFIRNCVNHPGVWQDNCDATIASVLYFMTFKNNVGYEIYNEPAYPAFDVFCYHPASLRTYQAWQESQGLPVTEAPRVLPADGGDMAQWIQWRRFSTDQMSDFLGKLGYVAKAVDPVRSVFTNLMPCPVKPKASYRGEDYYRVAQYHDFLGMDEYPNFFPQTFYNDLLVLDASESAAAVLGKKMWLIEYDASLRTPDDLFEAKTYAAIGSGIKGLLFYQWRSDYPFQGSPEPNGFGIITYDGQHTSKHLIMVSLSKLVNRYSEQLACAKKVRRGVALLYSNATAAYYDGLEKPDLSGNTFGYVINLEYDKTIKKSKTGKWNPEVAAAITQMPECYMLSVFTAVYRALRKLQIPVDFVRAEDLTREHLCTQVLIVPDIRGLSPDEQRDIDRFAAQGKTVVYSHDAAEIQEKIAEVGIEPPVVVRGLEDSHGFDVRLLQCDDGALLTITNIGGPVEHLSLTLGQQNRACSVLFDDVNRTAQLAFRHEPGHLIIELPEIHNGGLIWIAY